MPTDHTPTIEALLEQERLVEKTGVLETRIIDISDFFTTEDFEKIREAVLSNGEFQLFGNAYPELPYQNFEDYMVYLLPETGTLFLDNLSADAYRTIAIRDFYHNNIGNQYYFILLDEQDKCLLEVDCDTGLPNYLLTGNLKIYIDAIMSSIANRPS